MSVSSLATRELGAGNQLASSPDFFRNCAHDLFVLGALYRSAGFEFNRALNSCERGNSSELGCALTNVRANTARIVELAREIEKRLDVFSCDDWQDNEQVYGQG